QGHDDAADAHDGRHHQHRAAEHHQHLDLLHIVGDPGDERRRTELGDLPAGEAADVAEDGGAYVPAEAHGDAGCKVDGRDDARDVHQAHDEHPDTRPDDVAGVAHGNAAVDDVRVEARQVQHRDGAGELQQHDRGELAPVG